MTVTSLLILLLIGAIAGWLAGLLMRGRGLGLVGNIVVGILGAFVGSWLLGGVLGIAIGGGLLAAIINATIGAVIVLAVIGVLKRA
ncbi:MAG: GlsB/YeaQ/YmgE family stress response membrane protein [Rhodanobacteraceae bacterium]|nr:GlsB/YeaQ/YmgE family stress response membrane protein [Rhodanobacteraceae bacterium]